jgi:uncharacterized protein (TIGR02466 family)
MKFRQEIFATPLYVAVSDNVEVRSLVMSLLDKVKDKTETWKLDAESGQQEKNSQFADTTFYLGNLAQHPDWAGVVQFLEKNISTLFSQEYQGKIEITNMWANIYGQEKYVPEHIHNNSFYSGVFYVQADHNCGNIVWKDPAYISKTMSSRLSTGFPSEPFTHTQQVESGMICLFPSWLPHSTQPNQSNTDRVILSFNINFPYDS